MLEGSVCILSFLLLAFITLKCWTAKEHACQLSVRKLTWWLPFVQRNSSPSWSDDRDGNLTELVLQNEMKVCMIYLML